MRPSALLSLMAIALATAGLSGCGHRPQVGRARPCGKNAFLASSGRCVPLAWRCSPALYDAGVADGCDCDCGAPDPDCGRKGARVWCYGAGMARQVADCKLCGPAPGERVLQKLFAQP